MTVIGTKCYGIRFAYQWSIKFPELNDAKAVITSINGIERESEAKPASTKRLSDHDDRMLLEIGK